MIIPNDVQYILNIFKKNNYKAFLVGGCVRDSLLRRDISDYDIATESLPENTMMLFPKHIPTGLQHGTITVLINKKPYEVTTFRTESNYINNRQPEKVEFVNNIIEDLSRRDFTINALAYNPETGLVDYFNGIDDLNNKIIKCVGNADIRFQEDALRMLRAIRFACKLNFKIEANTLEAIKRNNQLINNISKERINDELCKILITDYPVNGIELLKETKLLEHILPEVYDLIGKTPLCTNHNRDIFKHTMSVLKQTPNNLLLRLSALLHDVGKVKLIKSNKNNLKFRGHAEFSYEMSKSTLQRLKFDNNTIKTVSTLIRYHMEVYENPTKLQIKYLIRNVGVENIPLLFDLQRSDILGIGKRSDMFIIRVDKAEKLFYEILANNEPLFLKDLNLNGNDLINELGIVKGKQLGEYLNECLDYVLKYPEKNKKSLLIQYIQNKI